MRYLKIATTGFLFAATLLNAGWLDSISNVLKETKTNPIDSTVASTTDLTQADMNLALKKALNMGVEYAVKTLGAKDGYLNNPLTKIVLPENLQKSADLARKIGGDKYVDDLIIAFNNAATEAAPKTAEIFAKSISNMSIDDAKKILNSSNTAATDYFRATTIKELQETIAPIVQKSMSNNSVAMYYETFQSFYKENSGMLNSEYISSAANMLGYGGLMPSEKDEDLNSYVTNKSIDGLMLMIQAKEKEIRDNPLSQNSDLIKRVFSAFE